MLTKNPNQTTTGVTNFRIITKKEFGNLQGIKNRKSIKRRYEDYLFAVGKPRHIRLTNVDIYKIDGISI